MTGDIRQFSIDVVDDGIITSDEVKKILEDHGISVVGCMWKAQWTNDDYFNSKPPYLTD